MDANRGGAAIGKRAGGIVAGGARHAAIRGQPALEEQFLAEGNFLRRLWVVGRCHRPRQLDRKSNLLQGPAIGQGARFGERRRLSSGLSGRAGQGAFLAEKPHAFTIDHKRGADDCHHDQAAQRRSLLDRHGAAFLSFGTSASRRNRLLVPSEAGDRRPHPPLVHERPLGCGGVPVEFAHDPPGPAPW